jgi:hemerythrin-like domain-containing protein
MTALEDLTAVQIGAKPDAGFDDPIGMLRDCHRRIERFVGLLGLVARQAEGRALSPEECEAVEASLRYFRESGPRHNCDEEESLFPRMRQGGAGKVLHDVLHDVDRLEGEHRQSEALHKEASELFDRWMADGELSVVDRSRLHAVTTRLAEMYREHIRIEEQVVFPCASQMLDRKAVESIGAEFRSRRG